MAHPLENRMVDFLDDDRMRLARIVKGNDTKLQGEDPEGRGVRVNPRHVLSDLGPASGPAEFARLAGTLASELERRAAEIDAELLWESVHGETRDWTPAELADAWFSASGPRENGAIVRALLAAPGRFKRNQFNFCPRTAAEWEEQRLQQQRKAERLARVERLSHWLRDLLAPARPADGAGAAATADPATLTPEQREFLDLATAYLLENQANACLRQLQETFPKAEPKQVALELVARFGRLPEDADPFLLRHGIVAPFPAAAERAAAELAPFAGATAHRRDLTQLRPFSIDDASTREIDDALSLEVVAGRFHVGIHIADPAAFIHRKDPLDQVAFDRTLTLYLPTSVVTMLPERVGCDLASLNAGQRRPALSFLATLDAAGELLEFEITRSQIQVHRRLTYDETDALLAAATPPAEADAARLHHALRELRALGDARRARRHATGALQLARLEVDPHVEHGEITLKRIVDTPARLLVSEFMVLANHLAALFALRHDLPFIFRSQEGPSEPVPAMTEPDPVLFSKIVKTLNKSRLSTQPLPHAGLGLDLYTQISSPLRRYADLVLQRQLAARLAGEELPYSALELIEVLGAADETEGRNRQLERQSSRYWVLEWLRRQPAAFTTPAVAFGGPWIELLEFGVRGRLAAGSAATGERFPVRLERVEPASETLVCARLAPPAE